MTSKIFSNSETSMYTLYYSPGAASLVVHWVLIELDLPHELVKLDFDKKEQKSPAYLALNPSGVVPTLLIDGKPMSEAAAIVMYLADSHPDAGLSPSPGSENRKDFYQWMFHLANAVQPLFRSWWYPHEPAGEANIEAAKEHTRIRIESGFANIDTHLGRAGPYLLGEQLSVADFMLVMLMRWSRGMPKTALDFPNLAKLANQLRARPGFKALYTAEGLTEWA
jgi:glutathione S-transferase